MSRTTRNESHTFGLASLPAVCATLALSFCVAPSHVVADDNVKPAGAKPAEQVQAAIDDAVRLLEKRDYGRFLEFYAPPVELQRSRERDEAVGDVIYLIRNPQTTRRILSLLKQARGVEPTFNSRGYLATIEVVEKDDADPGVPEHEEPPPKTVAAAGFGDDLNAALDEAIKTLEQDRDMATFIEKMYPLGELTRLQQGGGGAALAKQFDRQDALSEKTGVSPLKQMVDDLKLVRNMKPEMSTGGDVATYKIDGGEIDGEAGRRGQTQKFAVPGREVRFQKVDGDWRLFDSASEMREKIAAQTLKRAKGLPSKVVFERFGTQWRLHEIPE